MYLGYTPWCKRYHTLAHGRKVRNGQQGFMYLDGGVMATIWGTHSRAAQWFRNLTRAESYPGLLGMNADCATMHACMHAGGVCCRRD